MGQRCRASKRCGARIFHYTFVYARSRVFVFAHANSRDTNSVMAKPIPFFKDKVVLVTGASSGIGEEMALQLGRSGAKLTLAARRKERLENLARTIAESGGGPPPILEGGGTRA